MRDPRIARAITRARAARLALASVALFGALVCVGCGSAPEPRFSVTWIVGTARPNFDPGAPPDPVRYSLERLLGRGLLDEDTTGAIVPGAASRYDVTADGLTYTFTLAPKLHFGDGSVCTSADFARAIEANLNRLDHATNLWLLTALVGADRVQAGRPLPPLGIATPTDSTLVLRLAYPDTLLPRKLTVPGVAVPWPKGKVSGEWRSGLGDYRVASDRAERLALVRRAIRLTGPDTIYVRFERSAVRVRDLLRAKSADLVWPVPPGALQNLAGGAVEKTSRAWPECRLLLVQRADLPPTSKPEARHALAHGLDGAALLNALRPRLATGTTWLSGGTPFEFPRHDPALVRDWLERGEFRRSLHVVMAYSANGVAAEIARAMQSEWARFSLDIELRPLAAAAFAEAIRTGGGAQLLLVESQSVLADPVAELAALVVPARGPLIGGLRTGWRTREFDPWLRRGIAKDPFPIADVEARLEEEQIVLPIASLPWVYLEGPAVTELTCHPHFGPDPRTLTIDSAREAVGR